MPSINMIAPRRMEKNRLEKRMRYLAFVFVLEIGLGIVVGMWMTYKLLGTNNQIANYEVQLTTLKPVVTQIENYKSEIKILQPKLNLLGDAKKRTLSWYGMLERMMATMPDKSFLNRISITVGQQTSDKSTEAPKQILTLGGVAESQAKVGELMMRIQKIPELKNVVLNYTQKASGNRSIGVDYVIESEFDDSGKQ